MAPRLVPCLLFQVAALTACGGGPPATPAAGSAPFSVVERSIAEM
jgi:hypothetical protein